MRTHPILGVFFVRELLKHRPRERIKSLLRGQSSTAPWRRSLHGPLTGISGPDTSSFPKAVNSREPADSFAQCGAVGTQFGSRLPCSWPGLHVSRRPLLQCAQLHTIGGRLPCSQSSPRWLLLATALSPRGVLLPRVSAPNTLAALVAFFLSLRCGPITRQAQVAASNSICEHFHRGALANMLSKVGDQSHRHRSSAEVPFTRPPNGAVAG